MPNIEQNLCQTKKWQKDEQFRTHLLPFYPTYKSLFVR